MKVECFHIFGTPTLIFPKGHVYHLELSSIPAYGDLEIWRAVEVLANDYPYVQQLKRVKQAEAA